MLKEPSPYREATVRMLIASALFSTMVFLVRWGCASLHPMQCVFVRGAANALLILPFLSRRDLESTRVYWRELALRGTLGTFGVSCIFSAVLLIPLANVTALARSSSLFIPFIAAACIGEKLKFSRVAYATLGFGGALLILKPEFGRFELGGVLALGGAAANAAAFVTIRHVSAKVSVLLIMFWFLALSAIYAGLFFGHTFSIPTAFEGICLAGIVATGLAGQYFVTSAFAGAPASVIGPWQYSEMVFSALLGAAFLGQLPDLQAFAGMFVIAIAAMLVTRT